MCLVIKKIHLFNILNYFGCIGSNRNSRRTGVQDCGVGEIAVKDEVPSGVRKSAPIFNIWNLLTGYDKSRSFHD